MWLWQIVSSEKKWLVHTSIIHNLTCDELWQKLYKKSFYHFSLRNGTIVLFFWRFTSNVLKILVFNNSKSHFIYLNTLFYNTSNIKYFIILSLNLNNFLYFFYLSLSHLNNNFCIYFLSIVKCQKWQFTIARC